MTKKQAIEDSIKHWERMIKWAKKQPKRGLLSMPKMKTKMFESIGEYYGGDDCPLCQRYLYAEGCEVCPLGRKYRKALDKDLVLACVLTWRKAYGSTTWAVWLKYAKLLLKDLKSLHCRLLHL